MDINKICTGIVTYNPDILKLESNIKSIIKQTSKIIILDNASKNYDEIENMILKKYSIDVIRNCENLGIAKALNQLCEKATNENYDWILTLDQDSISPNTLIENLTKYTERDVAIVAPNIVYKNNESFAIQKKGVEHVEWVITSASLTNLKLWSKIKFDENLFIDGVDRDYCTRANRLGYKIVKDFDIELLHELGNLKCIKIFGKTIYITNHSPFRKYYMIRNVIYLDKKLNQNRSFKYISKNILKTVFFEKQKIKKLKAIFNGIKDGKQMSRR